IATHLTEQLTPRHQPADAQAIAAEIDRMLSDVVNASLSSEERAWLSKRVQEALAKISGDKGDDAPATVAISDSATDEELFAFIDSEL
ncbi:hypothetical protein, partial [Streptomyces albospinus]|uniref:hypothetical protein n=1 Tax=Streptomyces albospinus TaxID=285515 RepID=UPI001671692F